MTLTFDMLQTLGLSVLAFLLGVGVKNKVKFFQTYFIPAPVIGGLIFSFLIFLFDQAHLLEVKFDPTLQDFFMNLFFTCIGFTCSMAVLKKSGRLGALLALSIILMLLIQDLVGVGLAPRLGLHPLLGLSMGSISMSGGLGSALSFGPILEEAGAFGATAVGAASATFGLVLGSFAGGPVANRLIRKYDLRSEYEDPNQEREGENRQPGPATLKGRPARTMDEALIFSSVVLVLLAAFFGTYLGKLLNLTGLKFPYYVGCQFSGAIFRNLLDAKENIQAGPRNSLPFDLLPFTMEETMGGINLLGKISLDLFLSMAIMTLNIRQLLNLALPMIVILMVQTVVMMAWAYTVDFSLLGKNYDAAVVAAGHCGVGLGQTPNAIANMATIIEQHGPAPLAWFLLPVVMAIAINLMNPVIITVFIRIFQ